MGFKLKWLVVGAVACCLLAWNRPCNAGQDEPADSIEQHWRIIEADAARPPRPLGSAQRLIEANQLISANRRIVEGAFKPNPNPQKVLELKDGRMDPILDQAVADLLAWRAQGGGLGDDVCEQPPGFYAIPLIEVGRLALASAEGPEDPRVEAIVSLAEQLRRRGDLNSIVVGHSLARIVAERFLVRGWAMPERLWRLRPRPDEIRPIMARHAVCVFQADRRESHPTSALLRAANFDLGPHLAWFHEYMKRWEGLHPTANAATGSGSGTPGR